jgi:hypothetical protein
MIMEGAWEVVRFPVCVTKTIRCSRCGRRWRGQDDWNATLEGGHVVGVLCPDCQTPEENAEAEINQATLEYLPPDEQGRARSRPKREEG